MDAHSYSLVARAERYRESRRPYPRKSPLTYNDRRISVWLRTIKRRLPHRHRLILSLHRPSRLASGLLQR